MDTSLAVRVLNDLITGGAATRTAETTITQTIDADPANYNMQTVIDAVADLTDTQTWSLYKHLATVAVATSPAVTYLQSMVDTGRAAAALLDPRPLAKQIAAWLARGAEIGNQTIDLVAYFCKLLTELDYGELVQTVKHLGIEYADEFCVTFAATAAQAGLIQTPQDVVDLIERIGFGESNRPGNKPEHMYIGDEAHILIGAVYWDAHLGHSVEGDHIWINRAGRTVAQRITELYPEYEPEADAFVDRMAGKRPDILEINIPVHGIGVVYEIKSIYQAELAVKEALWYQQIMRLLGLHVDPGPSSFPGTFGEGWAPNGVFRWSSPAAGAITYQYWKAPAVKIRARDEARGRPQQKGQYEDALVALGVAVALVVLVDLLLVALAAAGFVVVLVAA